MDRRGTASFEELVVAADDELDLAAASLAFAAQSHPDLDRGHYLARLDAMAEQAARDLPAGADILARLSRLNTFLFEEEGFAGNRDDYQDPRNSYLHEVMDRRLGIPITLSVLYMEIGSRLGLRLQGVSFPGHFLVKCQLSGGEAVLDCFNRGVSLGAEDLVRMASMVLGRELEPSERLGELIAATGRRAILSRMLRNLKLIHLRNEDGERALPVLDAMLLIEPDSAPDRLDRARLFDDMGAMRAALADYERFLTLAPPSSVTGQITSRCEDLRARLARLN